MKKLLTIILILITTSCTNISVLEIKNVQRNEDLVYRITYQEKWFTIESVYHQDFYTLHGVNNFINEVADKDLSGWNQ